MDLDGTDVERKLSSDRLWIAKNRLDFERLWGRRNVNHGRGCFVEAFAFVRI